MTMQFAGSALVIGILATAILDLVMAGRQYFLGLAAPDYALVGRWIAGMPRGYFVQAVSKAPPVAREGIIGWTAHYVIGAGFASLLLTIFGLDWVRHPALLPALAIGLGGVIAPFFVMQPGMGLGGAEAQPAGALGVRTWPVCGRMGGETAFQSLN